MEMEVIMTLARSALNVLVWETKIVENFLPATHKLNNSKQAQTKYVLQHQISGTLRDKIS